ncbi:DUF4179 domain-containing protein, partial [Bacillus cereus]|uniref:DUF4179 domain-containing protein n=1 Tax=Bacillus cereus TaxID=1396 RepID=UPI001F4FDDCB
GKYIPIDEKITDQGITVHFKELFIADTRISVHYKMEKADGSLVPFELGKKAVTFIQNTDENTDRLPFELMAAGKKLETGTRETDKPEGIVTFVIDPDEKDAFKQPLTLDVNIDKIGKVSGSWKGQIQIDTSHLKNNTN